ncbi:hypothetical protein VNI00_013858 [Paramarasmius palmivorus]|uniref:Uncharacterized protein n=1 Tax=Paramarasmius palmivorus TaxID=297713 RepID=A0AAW0BWH8_9AGAR
MSTPGVYLTRSVRRALDEWFPATEHSTVTSELLLGDLVDHRFFHEVPELSNIDPWFLEVEENDVDGSKRENASPSCPKRKGSPTPSVSNRSVKKQKSSGKGVKHQPPAAEYKRSLPLPQIPKISSDLDWKNRKKARSLQGLNIRVEHFLATSGFNDIQKNSRISKPCWQGLNISGDFRKIIKKMLGPGKKLQGLSLIWFNDSETFICDAQGRIVVYRSAITDNMRRRILQDTIREAAAFMAQTKAPAASDITANLRGNHWYCIVGYDRNNKKKPQLSLWHQENQRVVDEFFTKEGSVFAELTAYGCGLLRRVFPKVAERFESCSKRLWKRHRIRAPYGLFFNWCLNGVVSGVPRVHCEPHVDFKNVALGVCMVYVYGHFNHREKCWLVIWEAGIALELPPGVFVIYPSSLFLHFNVDIEQLDFVVTDGERPTQDNARPLCECRNPDAAHGSSWQTAEGRGSIVWFNQATMFQTAELGYDTVKAAKEAGLAGVCNKTADDVFSNVF